MKEEDRQQQAETQEAAPQGSEEKLLEEAPREEGVLKLEEQLKELNDRYLRLYAEFDNYKKRVARDRQELFREAHEGLLRELLPSLDNLERALQHAQESTQGLVEGVEMTLKELRRTLEKFGLRPIEALGRPFDPRFHHAVSQVERDDVQDQTVVEELRKGYMYGEKVLRASLVAVSRRPQEEPPAGEGEAKKEEESTEKEES